jgi:hypothetical protein
MTEIDTRITAFAAAIRNHPVWPPDNDALVWDDYEDVPDVVAALAVWGAQKNNAETHVIMPQRYGFDANKVGALLPHLIVAHHPQEAVVIGQAFAAALNGDPEMAGMFAVTLQDADREQRTWALLAAADLYRKMVVPVVPKPGPRR